MQRFFLLAAMAAACVVGAQAQTFVIPQTVQQTLGTNVACNGLQQNFPVQNLGQTQHYFYLTFSVVPSNSLATVQGIDNAGNVSVISDAAQGNVSTTGSTSALVGFGYFPQVRLNIVCTGGTYTVAYQGTSATAAATQGAALATQVDKVLLLGVTANSAQGSQLATPPFGSSAGYVTFTFVTNPGPANSTLTVQCGGSSPSTNIGTGHLQLYTVNLGTAAGNQIFPIPAAPCPFYNVQYQPGGASTTTLNMEYTFFANTSSSDPCITAPRTTQPINTTASAQIITGTAATNVYVCSILIFVSAADNVALVEGTGATCGTGTLGLSGGATAATGWNMSANESVQMTGPGTFTITALRGDNVCLLVSSAAQVSGTITYAKL
jgi:hypothetical protein